MIPALARDSPTTTYPSTLKLQVKGSKHPAYFVFVAPLPVRTIFQEFLHYFFRNTNNTHSMSTFSRAQAERTRGG